jgi:hypothetical protein
MIINEVSEAIVLRDAAFERITRITEFKRRQKAPILQFGSDDLPAVSVYIARDQGSALGDLTAGEPRFRCILTLGIGVITFAKPEEAEASADLLLGKCVTTLLHDPTYIKMFDGVAGYNRANTFPREGETYFAQCRYDLMLQYETAFPPLVLDDLTEIRVTARVPTSDDNDPEGVADPISVRYTLPIL